ncbi:MAG: ATP-binding protein [Oscillospiraceae bacterium]|nr:ATP-binding protein [Oscillospiraceae bacterium]
MPLDGKTLAKARTTLAQRRRRNDEEFERKLERVYAISPLMRSLDLEIRETMRNLVSIALSKNNEDEIDEIRIKNLELQDQRRMELERIGYSESYLDDAYFCPDCQDSGYVGTSICACLLELYKEEQKKSLSNLLKLGNETFDNFDLSYYSDGTSPGESISPRRSMELIYETCVEYARKFSDKNISLFFNGSTGLGKTFLSACIARVVSDNGHSVVYDTAISLFSVFEELRFNRTEDSEDRQSEANRYMQCDLLILDDLGSEMTNSFTISTLYDIINTRLITGKKTIISSNLKLDDLRNRYSDPIMSRIEGEYDILTFRGDDIRRKKKTQL